ncbi:FAD-dependent monooxygenase [Herbaspirillum lusitanum]|uniref:FAD-dependent monooxygenase n=1 Tax=Herbaspirillum lusitanum TaxID=213312 RepID=A0ABW9AC63_9BURK
MTQSSPASSDASTSATANSGIDIAICGAGPVGLSMAALLLKRGVAASRIALIDAKEAQQAAHDPRSIALSYGSRQLLEEIGAWHDIAGAANPIHQIHVSRRGHFGRTLIDRSEYDLPALGYVTRYGVLSSALHATVADSGIRMLRPAQVDRIEERDNDVLLHLRDGSGMTAGIAIQAEGGVFSEQSAKSLHRDYEQIAIVAQVHADAAGGLLALRAFERFTAQGPLALLPQDDGYALVWCVRPDTAQHLLALNDTSFYEALERAFGTRLGRFDRVSPRNSFPLGLNAQPQASTRVVAIGNAAQTLHPVAGQGFNLGLRDAAVLAGLLARCPQPSSTPKHANDADAAARTSSASDFASVLPQFAKARRTDRNWTVNLTDTMARIFASSSDRSLPQALLGLSLGVIDVVAPAKRMLAEQMMFGRR